MVSVFQRKLLREWKYIQTQRLRNRYNCNASESSRYAFYIKPQDSNLHMWHLVVYDSLHMQEIYIMIYIGKWKNRDESFGSTGIISDEMDFDIILNCLTPNSYLPLNRNISFTHFNQILIRDGLHKFIETLLDMIFTADTQKIENIYSIMRCWNRVMIKSFKQHFPELIGKLEYGDYKIFQEFMRKNNYKQDIVTKTTLMCSNGISNNTLACDDYSTSLSSSGKRKFNSIDPTEQSKYDDHSGLNPNLILDRKRSRNK
ncbi:hypothetical protein TPHA_0I01620 [Tetrapisispora phaffii CBS 4417]|uniref:Uncharacterized protein n=1 Tax=Tetrapisispora phaffii (strain ATCC 24235 / CBS 4417 / NBRC 1672 / NRRL Y-8282 / UCD 70-5) TaxID=1071381 RepID=G8BXN8_TETPH|nr:hypothetical protein TPHA_0I01620 [Tetrapisispora phaffii CBS 4417]CCE64666.1 hypothetical protein TPHA_0I01620 [Tetrapisispora phaffii CBS 4417]